MMPLGSSTEKLAVSRVTELCQTVPTYGHGNQSQEEHKECDKDDDQVGRAILSGLGGKPNAEKAEINVFGSGSKQFSGSYSRETLDLFGNGGAKVFGSAATSPAGGPFSRPSGGAFSSGSGGPGLTEFAGQSSGANLHGNTATFGGAPAFNGAPKFDSKETIDRSPFGSGYTSGSLQTFDNPELGTTYGSNGGSDGQDGKAILSGLGGKPNAEKAEINVFGSGSKQFSGSYSRETLDLFGNGGAKVFGSAATSPAGGPFSRPSGGAFGSGSGGPGPTEFAIQSSDANLHGNTATFGGAPAFNGAPKFDSKETFDRPPFGSGYTSGSLQTFDNPGVGNTYGSFSGSGDQDSRAIFSGLGGKSNAEKAENNNFGSKQFSGCTSEETSDLFGNGGSAASASANDPSSRQTGGAFRSGSGGSGSTVYVGESSADLFGIGSTASSSAGGQFSAETGGALCDTSNDTDSTGFA